MRGGASLTSANPLLVASLLPVGAFADLHDGRLQPWRLACMLGHKSAPAAPARRHQRRGPRSRHGASGSPPAARLPTSPAGGSGLPSFRPLRRHRPSASASTSRASCHTSPATNAANRDRGCSRPAAAGSPAGRLGRPPPWPGWRRPRGQGRPAGATTRRGRPPPAAREAGCLSPRRTVSRRTPASRAAALTPPAAARSWAPRVSDRAASPRSPALPGPGQVDLLPGNVELDRRGE